MYIGFDYNKNKIKLMYGIIYNYMNDMSGVYISSSGFKLPFEIGPVADRFLLSLEGRSRGIADATADRAPGWKGAIGNSFWVSKEEYEYFITNVLDKNIEWLLGDENSVPGKWTTCELL